MIAFTRNKIINSKSSSSKQAGFYINEAKKIKMCVEKTNECISDTW